MKCRLIRCLVVVLGLASFPGCNGRGTDCAKHEDCGKGLLCNDWGTCSKLETVQKSCWEPEDCDKLQKKTGALFTFDGCFCNSPEYDKRAEKEGREDGEALRREMQQALPELLKK